MEKIIGCILLILVFYGCGEQASLKPDETRVIFTRENNERITLNKGVIIYAKNLGLNKTTTLFGTSLNNLQDEAILPNGNYLFFATGYDGATTPFVENRYCGIANNGSPVSLNGGTVTITMTLSQTDNCPAIFAPNNTDFRVAGNLKPFRLHICPNDGLLSCGAGDTDCYRIDLVNYKDIGLQESSQGISGDYTAVASLINNLKIPYGPDFKLRIRRWSTPNTCAGTLGPAIILNNITSLPAPANGINFGVDYSSSPVILKFNGSLL